MRYTKRALVWFWPQGLAGSNLSEKDQNASGMDDAQESRKSSHCGPFLGPSTPPLKDLITEAVLQR
jgi:hypothetical protein